MTTRDTTAAETCGAGNAWPAIEWLPTTTPQINPKNARQHSRKQIRKIATSIKECGFLNAIILDDNNVVLAGHGRLAAARLLNLRQVPVLRFSHLNDAQKRAYVIADNKIAEEAGWDRDLLAIELGELIELLPVKGLDIALTGFDVGEIDLLFTDMADAKAEPEDISPEPPRQPVSRSGDLWQLGKHRLMCGDARQFPTILPD